MYVPRNDPRSWAGAQLLLRVPILDKIPLSPQQLLLYDPVEKTSQHFAEKTANASLGHVPLFQV